MFLLVSILTETDPLVTNSVSTRWSPPVVLSGAVLMIMNYRYGRYRVPSVLGVLIVRGSYIGQAVVLYQFKTSGSSLCTGVVR